MPGRPGQSVSRCAAAEFVNRPEQVGRPPQVVQGELQEQLLARAALASQRGDLLVVGASFADRALEDRRIRSQTGDRQLGMQRASAPSSSISRVMLSSQRLCPRTCNLSVLTFMQTSCIAASREHVVALGGSALPCRRAQRRSSWTGYS